MSKTLREIASDEPIFVEVLSKTSTPDKGGVLFVNNADEFVFKWTGHSTAEAIVASYVGGYVRFPYFHSSFLGGVRGQRTDKPRYVVHSNFRHIVEADRYDRVRVVFSNIFTGIQQDIHEHKIVDLHEVAGMSKVSYKGTELAVYIGGNAKFSTMPRTATYRQDRLVFQFTGEQSLSIEDVNRMVNRLRQTITLFTKKPCDPTAIELGMRYKDDIYHYGTCEYGTPDQHAHDSLKMTEALVIAESGGVFLRACATALECDITMPAGQWFAYCEARAGRYYLDAVASNLLSCAESVFYLLLDDQSSAKRGDEYDRMLTILREQHKTEVKKKLLDWLRHRKRDYEDPKSYADKIKYLMVYAGIDTARTEPFRTYLNQLRNQIMHGLPRTWDTVRMAKGDEVTDLPINIGDALNQLENIVQQSLVKWLSQPQGVKT